VAKLRAELAQWASIACAQLIGFGPRWASH
jgi:hypothetical protein